jgi:hypothetical protein
MTIEELPGEYRVTPEAVPGDILDVIAYLTKRDALIYTGTPEGEIASYADWRAALGKGQES